MYKWKASQALRWNFIKLVFEHGYGDEKDRKHQPIRWTPKEMEDQCDDLSLLSLFTRYVTIYPDPNNLKQSMEREFLASIAISEMLEN